MHRPLATFTETSVSEPLDTEKQSCTLSGFSRLLSEALRLQIQPPLATGIMHFKDISLSWGSAVSGKIICCPVTFHSATCQNHIVFQERLGTGNMWSNTLKPLAITSPQPTFLWHKASDRLTLDLWNSSVSQSWICFQMRGSVKPYEPVRKAMLCSGARN